MYICFLVPLKRIMKLYYKLSFFTVSLNVHYIVIHGEISKEIDMYIANIAIIMFCLFNSS